MINLDQSNLIVYGLSALHNALLLAGFSIYCEGPKAFNSPEGK